MTTKGIIFSGPMVRALLDGRKTQTRRLLNPQPQCLTGRGKRIYADADWRKSWRDGEDDDLPYAPGDRLYVRETWSHSGEGVWSIADAQMAMNGRALYRMDHEGPPPLHWWPSIHMPRKFSRLWLGVTEVRVQRLQDISAEDAIAEGIGMGPPRDPRYYEQPGPGAAVAAYAALWNSLHTKPGETWADNPWIVAVSFTVHKGNIDAAHP